MLPSGVVDVGNWLFALIVSRSASPVPSAACQYRFGFPPPRVEVQMMRLPSGVQIGTHILRGVTVQRRQRLPVDVPDRNVDGLVPDVERDARAVWRDAGDRVGARRSGNRGFLALPVDPHQRARLPAGRTRRRRAQRPGRRAATPNSSPRGVVPTRTGSTRLTGSPMTSTRTGSNRTARSDAWKRLSASRGLVMAVDQMAGIQVRRDHDPPARSACAVRSRGRAPRYARPGNRCRENGEQQPLAAGQHVRQHVLSRACSDRTVVRRRRLAAVGAHALQAVWRAEDDEVIVAPARATWQAANAA